MDTITYNKIDREYKAIIAFEKSLCNLLQKEIERSEKWLLENYGITLEQGKTMPKEFRDRTNKEYHEFISKKV